MCCLKMLLCFATRAEKSMTELSCCTRVSLQGQTKKPKVFTSFHLSLLSLILTTFKVPCQRNFFWTFFFLFSAFSVLILLVLLCVLPSLSHHVSSASHLSPPLPRPSFTLVFASLSFMPFFSLYPPAL